MKRDPFIPIYITLVCFGLAGFILFFGGVKDALERHREPSPSVSLSPTPTPSPTPLPTPLPTPAPSPTPIPVEAAEMLLRTARVAEETNTRHGMYGRLVIPGIGIDVAVFTDGYGETIEAMRQNVCDAEDSALLYYSPEEGMVIADHSTQAFMTLINVEVGQRAYIITGGKVSELICKKLTDGHNNDHAGLVDENYESIGTDHDYVLYTCMDMWTNIRIAEFDIINEYQ